MPSPTITDGIPETLTPENALDVGDLPVSAWPSMTRIATVDLVGPQATNRQHQALQKRTITLANQSQALTAIVRVMAGIDVPIATQYARVAHPAASVPLASADTFGDDREHYLARDGSTVMWGRLAIGHSRTVLHAAAFDGLPYPTAYGVAPQAPTGYHWFQGPGSQNVANGDNDLAFGVRRYGVRDYELYAWRSGAQYRVITTNDIVESSSIVGGDVDGATGSFVAPGMAYLRTDANNDRVTEGIARLGVKTASVVTGDFADLAVGADGVGTGRSVDWRWRAYNSDTVGRLYLYERTKTTADTLHLPVLEIAYGDTTVSALKIRRDPVYVRTVDNDLFTGAHIELAVEAPAPAGKYPSIGFHRVGVGGAAVYYSGSSGGVQEFRVRGNDGFDQRIAYKNEVDAVMAVATAAATSVSAGGFWARESAGVSTFVVPAGVRKVFISATGGGGGGSTPASSATAGNGGNTYVTGSVSGTLVAIPGGGGATPYANGSNQSRLGLMGFLYGAGGAGDQSNPGSGVGFDGGIGGVGFAVAIVVPGETITLSVGAGGGGVTGSPPFWGGGNGQDGAAYVFA